MSYDDDWKDAYQEAKWEREAEKKKHQEWLDAGAILVPLAKVLPFPGQEPDYPSCFGPWHDPLNNKKDRS